VSNFVPTLIVFLVPLLIDQVVKYSVVSHNIFHYKNYGFILGLVGFRNPAVSVLLANAAMIFVLLYLFRNPNTYRSRIGVSVRRTPAFGLSLFLAGCASNLIDRITRGYVIDYLDWDMILISWPQNFVRFFNLADVFIVVGLILMGIQVVFYEPRKI